ncbi:MAG: VOC family protein [Pseudomonadota bacterium]
MQRVTGFGGFFFRADDSYGLAEWYKIHLGIDPVPKSADDLPWIQEAGPTIFAPFERDTTYFAQDKSFMLNFRVSDMDAMIEQLTASGVSVVEKEAMPGIGRFAHLSDPEGTPIELWEPAAS